MRLFISAGEPSGDLHGASLIRCLRERVGDLDVVGFGGDRMAEAGCRLVYPLCDLAVVGFMPVLASVPTFVRILDMARQSFRTEKPDALVMIDYPGFHWWLADCARKHGIPVSYFVPPQIWAWASWRARQDAPAVRSGALLAALRGAVVPPARHSRPLHRPSLFR